MKTAAIGAISAGVAVVAFILVFVGVGSNQAEKIDYQRDLEETVASESASPSEPSAPVQPTPKENSCDPSYPTVCISPYSPDLDCGEIQYSNFAVLQPDPHGFDGDNDGIGCEN